MYLNDANEDLKTIKRCWWLITNMILQKSEKICDFFLMLLEYSLLTTAPSRLNWGLFLVFCVV